MIKALIIFCILLVPLSIIATNTNDIETNNTLYGAIIGKLIALNSKLIKNGHIVSIPIVSIPKNVPIKKPNSFETRIKAFVTGYTFWDNTPPGSSDISNPIIHKKAGGVGTYIDPITVAVGHSIIDGVGTLDYPAGTRFYIPNLRKYFIVEDTCGDGDTPQNGPCHTGYPEGSTSWIDIWIDGATGGENETNKCAEAITGIYLIIKNPATNYKVVPGPVFHDGACASVFGDDLKLN